MRMSAYGFASPQLFLALLEFLYAGTIEFENGELELQFAFQLMAKAQVRHPKNLIVKNCCSFFIFYFLFFWFLGVPNFVVEYFLRKHSVAQYGRLDCSLGARCGAPTQSSER